MIERQGKRRTQLRHRPKVQYQRQERVAQINQRPDRPSTQHELGVAMNRKKYLVIFLCVWSAAQAISVAATIPAGTPVVVTTVDALSSHESPGRPFKTKLASDLKAGGKTVLPAGTVILGVVENSRNTMAKTTTNRLAVNLRSVSMNGREVPIKTTGALGPDTLSAVTPRQKITGVSAGKSVLPRGTNLEFVLAEPLNL